MMSYGSPANIGRRCPLYAAGPAVVFARLVGLRNKLFRLRAPTLANIGRRCPLYAAGPAVGGWASDSQNNDFARRERSVRCKVEMLQPFPLYTWICAEVLGGSAKCKVE